MNALTSKVFLLFACLSFSISLQAQCTAIPELVFENASLISGSTDVYRFPNVNASTDAIVSIHASYNASLVRIDGSAKGVSAAFQPKISLDSQHSNGTEGYIDFKIDFVHSGTENPIEMNPYVVSAVDIDGDNYRLRESVGFGDFSSFTLDGIYSALNYQSISGTNMMTFETSNNQGLSGIATHASSNSVLFDYSGGSSIIIRASIIDDGDVLPSKANKRLFSFNFDPCLVNCYGNPLTFPVEYNYFTVQKAEQSVELIWETAMEINNDRFEIERSIDGEEFQNLGSVVGVGNSDIAQQYSFQDQNPVFGRMIYRLKQVDFDGAFTYSGTQEILYTPGLEVSMHVYPNPSSDFIQVSSDGDLSGSILKVLDQQGRMVQTQSLGLGINQVDIRTLPTGIYFLEVQSETLTFSGRKIMKL